MDCVWTEGNLNRLAYQTISFSNEPFSTFFQLSPKKRKVGVDFVNEFEKKFFSSGFGTKVFFDNNLNSISCGKIMDRLKEIIWESCIKMG